jgi:hypothetical protein
MSEPSNDPDSSAIAQAAALKTKERVLVFIVAFLGLCIVAGIAAVVLRIIYLSSTREAGSAAPQPMQASPAASAAPSSATGSLSLPTGAVVKSVSLSGDRLAVHYEAAGEAGIAIVDVATGAEVRRIEIEPAGPPP